MWLIMAEMWEGRGEEDNKIADPEVYLGVAEQWWKNSDFLKMWRFIVIRKQNQSENYLLRIWAYRILSKNRVFLVIFDDLSERDNC